MDREDKVWALMSVLFGIASPFLVLLSLSGSGGLGFLFILVCPLVGLGMGVMAFKRNSLKAVAIVGILLNLIVPATLLLALTGSLDFKMH